MQEKRTRPPEVGAKISATKRAYWATHRMPPKQCIDCGCTIQQRATRCRQCFGVTLRVPPEQRKPAAPKPKYYGEAQPCEHCGTAFRPRKDAAPNHGRYCGRACANRAGRLTRDRARGDRNPNWTGGTTHETHLRVAKARWLKFRQAYLSTHAEVCELCGVPARILHHRIPVRQWPDGEFIESNIQVLCKSCHSTVENALRLAQAAGS